MRTVILLLFCTTVLLADIGDQHFIDFKKSKTVGNISVTALARSIVRENKDSLNFQKDRYIIKNTLIRFVKKEIDQLGSSYAVYRQRNQILIRAAKNANHSLQKLGYSALDFQLLDFKIKTDH